MTYYFIESVTFPDDDTEEIGEAVISCINHYECVKVVGSKYELTERVISVLKGLNS